MTRDQPWSATQHILSFLPMQGRASIGQAKEQVKKTKAWHWRGDLQCIVAGMKSRAS